MIGIEAKRRSGKTSKMNKQNSAGRKKPESQCNLGDDKRLRYPPRPCTGGCPHTLCKNVGGRCFRRLPERGEAGEHARDECSRHREGKNRPVQRDFFRPRK